MRLLAALLVMTCGCHGLRADAGASAADASEADGTSDGPGDVTSEAAPPVDANAGEATDTGSDVDDEPPGDAGIDASLDGACPPLQCADAGCRWCNDGGCIYNGCCEPTTGQYVQSCPPTEFCVGEPLPWGTCMPCVLGAHCCDNGTCLTGCCSGSLDCTACGD